MKTRLLAGCAILALGASGSNAADLGGGTGYYAPPSSGSYGPAGIFGDVHASASYFGGDGWDDWSANIGGVVVVPFGNGWNVALEADASYLFDADDWMAAGTGHLFYLNHAWAAGIFGTLTTEDMDAVGVEAAAFINNVDLVGSLGYGFSSPNFWEASGLANIYFDPNTAVSVGLAGVWMDGGGDFQMASLGIEHRFNNTPVSGFAEIGWSNAGMGDTIVGTAGMRYVFGASGQTLQDYNRANPF